MADDANYEIDWRAIIGGENDEASRRAAEGMDLSGLVKMFTAIVSLKK